MRVYTDDPDPENREHRRLGKFIAWIWDHLPGGQTVASFASVIVSAVSVVVAVRALDQSYAAEDRQEAFQRLAMRPNVLFSLHPDNISLLNDGLGPARITGVLMSDGAETIAELPEDGATEREKANRVLNVISRFYFDIDVQKYSFQSYTSVGNNPVFVGELIKQDSRIRLIYVPEDDLALARNQNHDQVANWNQRSRAYDKFFLAVKACSLFNDFCFYSHVGEASVVESFLQQNPKYRLILPQG